MRADHHVVPDLHQTVDLGALPDAGRTNGPGIHARVRADLDIVGDLDPTQRVYPVPARILRHGQGRLTQRFTRPFHMRRRGRDKGKAVPADHNIGLDDHTRPDPHAAL